MGFKDFVPAELPGQVAATPEASSSGGDLFEFDADPASSGEELDRELSDALGEAAPIAQPAPALPKARARRSSAAMATRPAAATRPAPPLLTSALPPPEPIAPAVAGPVFPQAMIAVLALLLVANVLTLVAGWKSQADVGSLLQRIGGRAAGSLETMRQQAIEEARHSEASSPMQGQRAEGYETLDLAQRAIDEGDFSLARRELFALQNVGDRLDVPVRDDVLARAAFMIADAYRLQAESLVPQEQRP